MEDTKVKSSIGNIFIPLLTATIGLIPFAYDKISEEPKAAVTTTVGLDDEKKKLALLSYEEGMSLYNKGLFEEAKISLKAAINQGGVVEAYYPMARCYMNGRVKDYEKFKFYCEEGVEKGDLKCHFGLWSYYANLPVSKNEIEANEHAKKAFDAVKAAAEAGDPFWQGKLGALYNYYLKDYEKALFWYEKAAEQDDAFAQSKLGVLYESGQGVEKDYKKALYWYEKAAAQDHMEAQSNLGFMYDTGNGVGKDYKKALYWYEKAADQGDAFAQNNLGVMYHNGLGAKVDFVKAKYWFQKAAEQGNKNAIKNMKMYR
ncbi:MAG TPA: tetratricopeptide repeat protein [Saprospiraceae bacterium]|nr:tetratricopeptide repeat protein [Saprospiraceae bacterium]HPI08326.1 tetratricopeptide repeat protein [Saprospiraceae bacterium]